MMPLSAVLALTLPFLGSASMTQHLQLTALVSDAEDARARFQCWEMSAPFSRYPTVGTAIPGLADVSNVSYVVLPPNSTEGLHKPPHPMSGLPITSFQNDTPCKAWLIFLFRFFVLLCGLAHVTLPEGEDELWIMEGVNGLMIAADVLGQGHYTAYPSMKETVALQVPLRDGKFPEHKVLNDGVCSSSRSASREKELEWAQAVL